VKNLLFIALLVFPFLLNAQLLPPETFITLRDTTSYVDVVFHAPATNSLSLQERNVKMFNTFIEYKTAAQSNINPAGFMMWLINGKEFLSGDFYLADTVAYIVFKKNGAEFVHRFTPQGKEFLIQQRK
jgi:hypothetical protein